MKRQGIIETIHDRRIEAGESLGSRIDDYIDSADLILCLLSPDFIASDYCYSHEMKRALEKDESGEARVIPVILRHCEWEQTPLKDLRGTPRDNKPIKAWSDIDEAFKEVVSDIRRAAQTLGEKKQRDSLDGHPSHEEDAIHITKTARSANLHIAKKVTDQERDELLHETFEYIAEFFANSLDELHKRAKEIGGNFNRFSKYHFNAVVYRNGKREAAVTVFLGNTLSYSNGIRFNHSPTGETNSSNGSYQLVERDGSIGFSNSFGSRGERILDREAMAEQLWAELITPLQRA
jgi:hypothetical protein